MTRRTRKRAIWALSLLVAAVVIGPPTLRLGHGWMIERRVARHAALIQHHAQQAGLDHALVRAVVQVESGGDPRAVSRLGAKGLMQVMPAAETDVLARHSHIQQGNLLNAEYNLQIGTRYLRMMMDRFEGDTTLALAAYHMGPTAVARIRRRHPGITPERLLADHAGPQTRAYVRNVLRVMREQQGE